MRYFISLAALVAVAGTGLLNSGCNPRVEAIAVSQEQLLIDYSTVPQSVEVWNTSTLFNPLTIDVAANNPWIVAEPLEVDSAAPTGTAYDRHVIRISIDRRMLTKGTHEGSITFHAPRAFPKTVTLRVMQNYDGGLEALRIINPGYDYSAPYLLNFSFTLRDANDRPVVAEPNQVQVTAYEGATPIDNSETGVHLRRGVARQLKVDLVLDYTISMQSQTGAIAAMENAAKNILLPALNEDALVGIWEFHRDDRNAGRVADFTVDRQYLQQRLSAIQSEFVQGFYSASRLWDAVLNSATGFDTKNAQNEARYIIVFSDGRDTSSILADAGTVVTAAKNRGIHIYTIGLGANINETELSYLASWTGGKFFTAASINELDDTFQGIVEDLGGQYVLRWATLRRDDSYKFKPSFTVLYGTNSVSYRADDTFVPSQHKGDVAQGELRLVASDNQSDSTVFLRADYVPRYINKLRLYVHSPLNFTVDTVAAHDDGLMDGWTLTVTSDGQNPGKWINVQTFGYYIPFATFGPLLRFDFDEVSEDITDLIDAVYVDNTLYPAGQSFTVDGYANTAPGS